MQRTKESVNLFTRLFSQPFGAAKNWPAQNGLLFVEWALIKGEAKGMLFLSSSTTSITG